MALWSREAVWLRAEAVLTRLQLVVGMVQRAAVQVAQPASEV